jgi:hypothetical protein
MRWESITGVLACWESDGLIVAVKRGNARGAKGPYWYRADVRSGETRLSKEWTTTDETAADLPEVYRHNSDHLPGKVFTLRQKLYRKAKREPWFRFYALSA